MWKDLLKDWNIRLGLLVLVCLEVAIVLTHY